MTRKLLRLVMAGFVGCTALAPLGGCTGSESDTTKPTVDVSTPIKAPEAPTTNKVEPKKPN
jgi:hypothetical protein